ncbi:Glycosyl transferases group 1 [anaerobic digester metagenome]
MVRVLIVSNGYESLSIRSINSFEESLRKKGEEIEVSFFLRLKEFKRFKNTYGIPRKKDDSHMLYSLKFICALIRHIFSGKKYDIFVVDDVANYGPVVATASKILRKKTILTIHGLFEEEWKEREKYARLKYHISSFLSKITLICVDQIVINDDRMLKILRDKGLSSKKIWKRYVCFDKYLFDRNLINDEQLHIYKKKYNLPDEYVLFVGSINKRDGIMDALNVFKKINECHPDVKFVIVGEGPLEPELDRFIKENPSICINHIGRVDYHTMPYIYYNSSVVLLPSHPPQAGIGKISLEALSMECPVITTNAGIFDILIEDSATGFIVPVGDIDAMVEKLIYLLKNPNIRQIIGKNGRMKVIEQYSTEEYLDNWAESLRILMKAPQNISDHDDIGQEN